MRILATFAIPLLASTAVALQDAPPGPAKELATYDQLLGSWTGSGSYLPEPGGDEIEWTATSNFTRVLGGHAIQEDVSVKFDSEDMPELSFRTLFGFDGEKNRHTKISVDNQGQGGHGEVHWTAANTMVINNVGMQGDQPLLERTTITCSKDSYSIVLGHAIGAGPFYFHVQGEFRRTESKPAPVKTLEAGMTAAALPKSFAPLAGTVGDWKVKGTMIPAPGMDSVPISGLQSVKPILGGAVLENSVVADADPSGMVYEEVSYMLWNQRDQCFDILFVNNMGMIGKAEMRVAGDALVVTHAGLMFGTPTVDRTLVELDENGGYVAMFSDQIAGTHEPVRAFEATFTRVKK